MASSVRVIVLQNDPTLLFTGTGEKVLMQAGQMYVGGSDVSTDNGVFLSGYYGDYFDLGVVAVGEEVYGLSTEFDNEVRILTIDAT